MTTHFFSYHYINRLTLQEVCGGMRAASAKQVTKALAWLAKDGQVTVVQHR